MKGYKEQGWNKSNHLKFANPKNNLKVKVENWNDKKLGKCQNEMYNSFEKKESIKDNNEIQNNILLKSIE